MDSWAHPAAGDDTRAVAFRYGCVTGSIASQLLAPNRAGNVKLYVTARTGTDASSKPVTYASGFISIKNVGLRLLVQPKETTTRGDKRALFEESTNRSVVYGSYRQGCAAAPIEPARH